MKTCVFIVTQLSQPRCIKRIETIQKAGIPFKVYGFDNGLYTENIKNVSFPIEEIMTNKEHGKIARILFPIKSIRRIINTNKENCVFYLFGFETAVMARIAGCKKYIYEEADVNAVKRRYAIQRKFLLALDRNIIRKSLLTVFTSQGFIDFLFKKFRSCGNFLLLPNKLSPYFNQVDRTQFSLKNININHVKFGFIGLIRYPNTIIRFAKVVGKYFPQHEFHFYGDIAYRVCIDDELKSFQNVYFHGSFSNPTDLQIIYSNIDINIVCYDTSSINVRIAEPNKLYESIYFNTPIVVSKGTYLEKRVKDLNVGASINALSEEDIIYFINNLDQDKLQSYIASMNKINSKDLIDNPYEFLNVLTFCLS
mgnify:CR=1 FL=1|jgi:glycosyltransferase involved in cell wall biosynthesis